MDIQPKSAAPIISVVLGALSLVLAVNPFLGGLPRLLPLPYFAAIALVIGATGLLLAVKSRRTDRKGWALAGMMLCGLALTAAMGFAVFLAYVIFSLHGI